MPNRYALTSIGFLAAAFVAWLWLSPSIRGVQVIVVGSVGEQSQQVSALRGQLEMLRQHDDQLVAIVTTTLQVVVALAFGLAAFSWFTNTRQYDRELAGLKQSLELAVRQAEDAINARQTENLQKARAEFLKAAADAGTTAAGRIGSELRELHNDFWWDQHMKFHAIGNEAFRHEKGPDAFKAHLTAFEALLKYDFGRVQHPDAIGTLEQDVIRFNYRPTADELTKLSNCLNAVHSELKPAADRLRGIIAPL